MRGWVLREDQLLAQWHLLDVRGCDEATPGRFRAVCGLGLGDNPDKLRSMTEKDVPSSRCGACAEKSLQRSFARVDQGD